MDHKKRRTLVVKLRKLSQKDIENIQKDLRKQVSFTIQFKSPQPSCIIFDNKIDKNLFFVPKASKRKLIIKPADKEGEKDSTKQVTFFIQFISARL